MSHDATLHPEDLLEHGRELRALARRLVRDEHRAADLVQDTWVRALERGPGSPVPLGRWLASVLRNLAFERHRLDARRAERERAVARGEAIGEHEGRFGAHRELVAAIDRLAEPYRQAILLRYFEDLPPRKIAARLGVPRKTVQARLNRGLGMLREELDRRHGGREEWLAAMVALARTRTAGAGLLSGTAVVQLAGAAALASAGIYLALSGTAASVERTQPGPALASTSVSTPEVELPSPSASESSAKREAVATREAAIVPIVPGPVLAASSGMRHGRVLDPEGNGLAGVWVGFPEGVEGFRPVQSDAGGGFLLPDLAGIVKSRDERFATVLKSELDPEHARPEEERIVVVAPAVVLGGIVRDEHGTPLAGVGVRIQIPLSFRGRFREVLDHSREADWNAETDGEGRFRLEGAPGLGCARLVPWSGHASGVGVPVPEHDHLGLELVLTPEGPMPGPDAVVGEVRHADGALAPGALVTLGGVITHADQAGFFELFAPPASRSGTGITISDGRGLTLSMGSMGGKAEPRPLVAVADREQAAVFVPERDPDGGELWPAFVTLWLGGEQETIAGRVIGTDGVPLADAPVWIEDLTFVAKTEEGFLTLEHLMAGKSDQWFDRWFFVHTDPEGRFELGGLAERDYAIAAMDPATLQIVRSGPLPAGSREVELVLSSGELWERLAGRVIDTRGEPLPGMSVGLERRTFEVRSQGNTWFGREERSPRSTDDDGHFELERVPRQGMTLRIGGANHPGVTLELDAVADPLDIRIVEPWLGHVQIVVSDPVPPDGSIELRDAEEKAVEFYVFGGGNTWRLHGIDLGRPERFAGGRTPVLNVPESARAVVLLDGEKHELRRVPLVVGEILTTTVQL